MAILVERLLVSVRANIRFRREETPLSRDQSARGIVVGLAIFRGMIPARIADQYENASLPAQSYTKARMPDIDCPTVRMRPVPA